MDKGVLVLKKLIWRALIALLAVHYVFVASLKPVLSWLSLVLFFAAVVVIFFHWRKEKALGSGVAVRRLRAGAIILLLVLCNVLVELYAHENLVRGRTALVGATIITGELDAADIRDGTVLISDDGKIVALGQKESLAVPQGYDVVDVSGKFIMPGLINAHAHMWMEGGDPQKPVDFSSYAAPRIVRKLGMSAIMSYPGLRVVASRMERNVQSALYGGVTTLRGVGDLDFLDVQLRDQVARGERVGPNLLAAGKIIAITGGHAAEMGRVVDGPVEARKAVREGIHERIDHIKICATGGVADSLRIGEAGELQMTPEEMRAVVDEAHRRNILVTAHAESAAGVKEALVAGVDNIEHGAIFDDEAADLFLNNPNSLRGYTSLHPTLSTLAGGLIINDETENHPVISVMNHNAAMLKEQFYGGFEKALAHGILVGVGTDSGVVAHNKVWVELKLFVEHGGVSPARAIHMGTLATARSIGVQDVTGSIEVGKRADLLVLARDPRDDLSLISNAERIIVNGYHHMPRE
jgi:imidazolonepropionase-like amidohydrolase